MQTKILLSNGNVLTDRGWTKTNIIISDGRIERFSQNVPENFPVEIFDVSGCHVFPSLVDMHVHLREPGFSYKETINTGTKAAAAGGFTTVCPMPNLNPAPDSFPHLKAQLDIIAKDAVVNVSPFATITKDRQGNELVDYQKLAPFVAGFSDDGCGVQSHDVMKKAMSGIAKTGKILAAHCEVEALLDGGYIHKGEYCAANGHKGICSESEWKEVERDIQLSKETGCRLHICHISTKETVDLVRNAKKEGLRVTCETGPHYLTFNDSMLEEDGRFKMNPPIRSILDQEALREGLIDGTIDVIATDHAPHSEEEKSRGLEKSAMGVVGLETAFAAVYTTMVASGLMPFEHLLERMAFKPREILGMPPVYHLEEGADADIAVAKLDEKFIVDPSNFETMGKASPYNGMQLQGKIKMTIYNGNPVYISL